MSTPQLNPFHSLLNWMDVKRNLTLHLNFEFRALIFVQHQHLHMSLLSPTGEKGPTYYDYRDKVVHRCCDAIRALWSKGYLFGSKMHCLQYQTDGSVRLYREFIDFAVRIMETILHVDGGGEKFTEVTDIEETCVLSEKKMELAHKHKQNLFTLLTNAAEDMDYDGIREITQDDYGFRNIDTTSALHSIFQNFTDKLQEMNIIRENYELQSVIARTSKASHRMNIRARDFKSWKLYVSAPIYPNIIGTMMYDESDSSTFNTQFIVPEDIGRIITEFVGHDFLLNIRTIIMNGDKTKITNDINDSLSKLRKDELVMIAKKSPYNYINFNKTYKIHSCPIISISSLSKPKLIDAIMTSFKNKEQYYPFYRDTVILSRIIVDNRGRRQQRERSEMDARIRDYHAKIRANSLVAQTN